MMAPRGWGVDWKCKDVLSNRYRDSALPDEKEFWRQMVVMVTQQHKYT
jgi:hypothetical protein